MCSVAQLCPTLLAPETVACQALLSIGLYRQECWGGMTFPSPGYLPSSGTEPSLLCLLHWQSDSFCPYSDPLSQLPSPVPLPIHQPPPCSLCLYFCFVSVQSLSHVQLFATSWTAPCQAPCPSPTPRVYPNSCPLSQWCHPAISSSVVPFSSYLQSFPASGSFPMSQFFTSHGQSIGASASASFLPINIQDWFPLRLTDLISLQSKGLSRVFSSTTVQKHRFFGTQLSL